MSQSIVLQKASAFALRIVRLYKYLCEERREYVLSKDCLIDGTRIGAHIKEAQQAGSRNGFHKDMSIALQKASRAEYWLQLLHNAEFLEERDFLSINADCLELQKMLTRIVKNTNENE